MPDAALSKLTRLAISAYQAAGAENPSPAGTIPLLFESFDPGSTGEMIDLGDTVGGFSNLGHGIELTRNNIVRVAPRGTFKPSTAEWDAFWRWILSSNPATAGTMTYAPSVVGGGPAARNIDWHDTQAFWHLTANIVAGATLSAEAGREVKLDLELAGVGSSNSGSYPTGLTPSYGPRFLFADNAITIAGTAPIFARSVRVRIDHKVQNDRFFYGTNSAGPVVTDRVVTVELDVPYGLHPGLASACAVDGGATMSMTFTYGAAVMTLTFGKVRSNAVSVTANVPGEMFLPWRAQAFCVLGDIPDTPELTVTLTP